MRYALIANIARVLTLVLGQAFALPAPASEALSRAVSPPCPLQPLGTRSVVRIVDVETLALDDGREVRLAGVIVPRAVDVGAAPGTWPPEEAARRALIDLATGRTVTLWGLGPELDRYERHFAQVEIADGPHPGWLQRQLIDLGMARVWPGRGMGTCSLKLLAAERTARALRLGLWAVPAYAVHEADAVADFAPLVGTFQIVRATVRRVSRGREGVYLSLAPRPRGSEAFGLAALLPEAVLASLENAQFTRAAGGRIEVRGWVEQRRGPLFVVEFPEQVSWPDKASDHERTF